jgi:thiol-disulfide isomerase/thioredoxin
MAVFVRLSNQRRLNRAAAIAVVTIAVGLGASCATRTPPPAVPAPPASAPASPGAPAPTPSPAPAIPDPLLGHVTVAQLKAYKPWAALWDVQYVPDAAAVATIKACPRDFTVLLVMGTWCPDSKRELPRYFATMAAAGVPDAVLTMVGVDRTKKDTEGLTDKWNITRVPTFVFLRDGREFGRFTERTPAGSTFEAEIAKILGGGERDAVRR